MQGLRAWAGDGVGNTGPSRGAESRLYGGLTSGAFAIAWWGFDAPARYGVDLGRVPRARREPVVFLEPLAKLTVWRRLEAVEQTTEDGATRLRVRLGGDGASGAPLGPSCWAASWPHPGNGVGTRPHGVHGSIWIARPLSSKEKAKILDIREDWGAPLADHFWRLEDGGFLPCRIPMEALIQALPAMLTGVARKPEGVFAWGNQRPFGVGVRDNSLRTTALAGLYFEPADAAEVDTAVKADTDEVDTSLWAVGGDGPGLEWSRGQLRTFLYGLYCRRLYLEAKRWLDKERVSPTLPDYGRSEAGVVDCLQRACSANWFEWSDGSRLFFWRWPIERQQEARDGHPVRHFYMPPRCPRARTLGNLEPWMKDLVPVQLRKFLSRRYLLPGGRLMVAILYFPVEKAGGTDIRLVWDETSSGVNDSVFAPRFFMPSSGTLCRRVLNHATWRTLTLWKCFTTI